MIGTATKTKLTAVGYVRTSGEGQRDNTSIPRQKEEIKKFISHNGWKFIRFYVDESKSGSQIEGRDNFKLMIKDAANSQFDLVIIYDITRFARDGSDIIGQSHFLKNNFGIHVVDTKAGFDTRKPKNTLLNFVVAGLAEDERLSIMSRTIGGRIYNAEHGLPWCANPPFGRAFKRDGKNSGTWYLTEDAERICKVLEQYAKGKESLRLLAKEYGFLSAQAVSNIIRGSQLSAGNYVVKFHSPEIGIDNLEVTVPDFPAVITPELEQQVRDRMKFNTRFNKLHKKKYLLSGFVKCDHCGKSLGGQTPHNVAYYCHYEVNDDGEKCPYRSIRADLLEGPVMDYLYSFFFDEASYDKAVKAALPSNDDREKIEKDISQAEKNLRKLHREIDNLVSAIANGADVSILTSKQSELKTRKQALEDRISEGNQLLAAMPDPAIIKKQSLLLRSRMLIDHVVKDWRKLSYEDMRQFLHFLFSDNPHKNNYGIAVAFKNNKWQISFKGCVDFPLGIIPDKAKNDKFQAAIEKINAETKVIFEKGISQANKDYKNSKRRIKLHNQELEPKTDNWSSVT